MREGQGLRRGPLLGNIAMEMGTAKESEMNEEGKMDVREVDKEGMDVEEVDKEELDVQEMDKEEMDVEEMNKENAETGIRTEVSCLEKRK